MRPELLADPPLVCPRCRRRDESGWYVHTLELAAVFSRRGDGVEQGLLRCSNEGCAHGYPIVDGIAVVRPHLDELLAQQLAAVVEGDLAPALAALFAEAGPDDSPYARRLEHLSTYLDGQWGDRAIPAPDGPSPGWGFAELAGWVGERRQVPVARGVELGCGVGRGLLELAAGCQRVVGLDVDFASLRRARRLLAGEPLDYLRRVVGRHYTPARIAAPAASDGILLVCADALDPPLVPAGFDRILALNLLDNVAQPRVLLAVLSSLVAPGGELLLASPYTWQGQIVADDERLGGVDPAATLRQLLTQGEGAIRPHVIEDERTLRWSLRRDQRSSVVYATHALRCRRRAEAGDYAESR